MVIANVTIIGQFASNKPRNADVAPVDMLFTAAASVGLITYGVCANVGNVRPRTVTAPVSPANATLPYFFNFSLLIYITSFQNLYLSKILIFINLIKIKKALIIIKAITIGGQFSRKNLKKV